jgi:hypothetical protein
MHHPKGNGLAIRSLMLEVGEALRARKFTEFPFASNIFHRSVIVRICVRYLAFFLKEEHVSQDYYVTKSYFTCSSVIGRLFSDSPSVLICQMIRAN